MQEEDWGTGEAMFLKMQGGLGSNAQVASNRNKNNLSRVTEQNIEYMGLGALGNLWKFSYIPTEMRSKAFNREWGWRQEGDLGDKPGLLGIIKCPPEVLGLGRTVGMAMCLSPATVSYMGTSMESREMKKYGCGVQGNSFLLKHRV